MSRLDTMFEDERARRRDEGPINVGPINTTEMMEMLNTIENMAKADAGKESKKGKTGGRGLAANAMQELRSLREKAPTSVAARKIDGILEKYGGDFAIVNDDDIKEIEQRILDERIGALEKKTVKRGIKAPKRNLEKQMRKQSWFKKQVRAEKERLYKARGYQR